VLTVLLSAKDKTVAGYRASQLKNIPAPQSDMPKMIQQHIQAFTAKSFSISTPYKSDQNIKNI